MSEKTKKNLEYTSYILKPLIHTPTDIHQWDKVLRHFRSIPEAISFRIAGNTDHFMIILDIPSVQAEYIEASFASTYDFLKLEKTSTCKEEINKISTHQHFIAVSEPDQLAATTFFMHNNAYLDPFKDILQIFHLIDTSSYLEITYTIKQHREITGFSGWFRQLFIIPKKQQVDGQTGQDTIYNVTISYTLKTEQSDLTQTIKNTLQSLFYTYCLSGTVQISPTPKSMELTTAQVSNLFHIPTQTTPIKGLAYMQYKELAYPPTPTAREKSIKLGFATHKQETRPILINYDDMLKHTYLVGKTGTGKSTCLAQILIQIMQQHVGCCVIDPHGDLVEACLQHIPSFRRNDVILFDVSDTEFPIGFNLLHYDNDEEKNLLVSGIIGVFYKLFSYSRGPRLEHTLRNALYAVLCYPQATLLHVMQLLTNAKFRKKVLTYVTDPIIKTFWEEEFNERSEKQRLEAIGPITNKIGQFLSSSLARNMFGQPHSKLDIGKAMASGKLIFVNLSKGKIGEDMAEMIGSLFVTKLQIETMKRAAIPYEERQPFFLCIDEFQNFTTDSFATILSEARKYKLGLILAHQYLAQLPEPILRAVLGNIRTTITFGLGFADAEFMAREYRGLRPEDFTALPDYVAYCTSANAQGSTEPFCLHTEILPPSKTTTDEVFMVQSQSRSRYALPKAEVEMMIQAWNNEETGKNGKKQDEIEGSDRKNEEQQSSSGPGAESKGKDLMTFKQNRQSCPDASGSPTIEKDKMIGVQNDDYSKPPTIELGNNVTMQLPPIGSICSGKVKFLFNYGIFVTVDQGEGLLHKNDIIVAPGVSRKKYYHEDDPITVIVDGYKEINGEMKIVWTQKMG